MELKNQGEIFLMDTEGMFSPGYHTQFWVRGVHVKKMHPNAKVPTKGSNLAAGYDLFALDDGEHDGWVLERDEPAKLIPTGIALDMSRMAQPIFGLIVPRSGLGHKKGLVLGNTVGIIDADYQGEIMISAWNRGQQESIVISPGERIAQIVFLPHFVPPLVEVDDFVSRTERGAGGFGSTGG